MIKKILAILGVCFSAIAIAKPQDSLSAEDALNALNYAIAESCGHITDASELKICVEIVEMDFTVVPHNEGGNPHCPGTCPSSVVPTEGQ